MKVVCVLCEKEVENGFSAFCKECLEKDISLLKIEDIWKEFPYKDELRTFCKKLRTSTYDEITEFNKKLDEEFKRIEQISH